MLKFTILLYFFDIIASNIDSNLIFDELINDGTFNHILFEEESKLQHEFLIKNTFNIKLSKMIKDLNTIFKKNYSHLKKSIINNIIFFDQESKNNFDILINNLIVPLDNMYKIHEQILEEFFKSVLLTFETKKKLIIIMYNQEKINRNIIIKFADNKKIITNNKCNDLINETLKFCTSENTNKVLIKETENLENSENIIQKIKTSENIKCKNLKEKNILNSENKQNSILETNEILTIAYKELFNIMKDAQLKFFYILQEYKKYLTYYLDTVLDIASYELRNSIFKAYEADFEISEYFLFDTINKIKICTNEIIDKMNVELILYSFD